MLFFGSWAAGWLPLAVPLAITLKWRPGQPMILQQKLPLLLSLYGLAPVVLWEWIRIEGTNFTTYGWVWDASLWRSFGFGLTVGVLGIVGLFGSQRGLGWLRWHSQSQEGDAVPEQWGRLRVWGLPLLLLSVWVSVTEESVFRGFILTKLQVDYPRWEAAAIASLVFAVLHLIWEGRTTLPQVPGLWLMGMVLSQARWVDHNHLGLACGLHAGWVWGIASLDSTGAMTYTQQVPEWVTGWRGKPLAGVLGLLFLGSTGVLLWVVLQVWLGAA